MLYIVIISLVVICIAQYCNSKKCKHSWETIKKDEFMRQTIFSRPDDWTVGPTVYTLRCKHCGDIKQRKIDPYND